MNKKLVFIIFFVILLVLGFKLIGSTVYDASNTICSKNVIDNSNLSTDFTLGSGLNCDENTWGDGRGDNGGNITANGVKLECNNYLLQGGSAPKSNGINFLSNNSFIKNCDISLFAYHINISANNATIINTITNSNPPVNKEIAIKSGYNATIINGTFTLSKVLVAQDSNAFISYWAIINITNSTGSPVVGANITIFNRTGFGYNTSIQTNNTGLAFVGIPRYVINSTATGETLNFNITARNGGNSTSNQSFTSSVTANYQLINLQVNSLPPPLTNTTIYTYLNNSRLNITISQGTSIWLNGTLYQNLTTTTIITASQTSNYRDGYLSYSNPTAATDNDNVGLIVGEDFGGTISATYVDFNTSSIPSNAFITSVNLSLTGNRVGGSGLVSFNLTSLNQTADSVLDVGGFPARALLITKCNSGAGSKNDLINSNLISGLSSGQKVNFSLGANGTADIKNYLNLSFFSLCIIRNPTGTADGEEVYFNSSESANANYKPQLIVSYSYFSPVNVSIQLYKNGTLINSGLSPVANFSNFTTSGIYNITAVFLGDSTYATSFETWWVNVTASAVVERSPQFSNTQANQSGALTGQTVNFTTNVFDTDGTGVDRAWFFDNFNLVDGTKIVNNPGALGFSSTFGWNTTNQRLVAQTFKFAAVSTLREVCFTVRRTGIAIPTGNLTYNIYSTLGGAPTTSISTANPINISGISTGDKWLCANFSVPPVLSANVTYAAVIGTTQGQISSVIMTAPMTTSSSYPDGDVWSFSAGNWSETPASDFFFNLTSASFTEVNDTFINVNSANSNISFKKQLLWASPSLYYGWCANDTLGTMNCTAHIPYLVLATPDLLYPTGSIIAPENATYLNGVAPIFATATDDNWVDYVYYQYRNSTSGGFQNITSCAPLISPYTCNWNTTMFSNNSEGYDISLVIVDAVGNVNSTVPIMHYFIDRTIPITDLLGMRLTYPTGQMSIRNTQTLIMRLNVTDGSGAGMNTSMINLTLLTGAGFTNMLLQSGTLSTSGSWTFWNLTSVLSGTVTNTFTSVKYQSNDSALPTQNRLLSSFTVVIDNTPPTYTALSNYPSNPIYNNTDVGFQINASDNLNLSRYILSTNITGSWANITANFTNPLSQVVGYDAGNLTKRNFSYYWILFDDAGNSNQTITSQVNILGPEPTITFNLFNPADNTYTNNVTTPFIWNYTGGAIASFCSMYLDTVLNQTVNSPLSDTRLNFTAFNLAEGEHTWYIDCNNTDGKFYHGQEAFWTIDLHLPNGTLLSPANNTFSNLSANNFTVNGTDDIGLANATLVLVNSTGIVAQVTTSFGGALQAVIGTVATVADNVYTWFYKIFDLAGNQFTTSNRTITIDTKQSFINIIYPQFTNYSYLPSAINYSLTEPNPSVCKYSLDGGASNTTITCGQNVTGLTSIQGWNNWTIYANDTVGHSNFTTVFFYVDSIKPTINFTNPSPSSGTYLNTGQFIVNFTGNDANFNYGWVKLGLSNFSATCTSTSTFYNCTRTLTGIADGLYNFQASSNDTLNNVNQTEVRTITIDTARPYITFRVPPTLASGTYINSSFILANVTLTDANTKNITFYLFNSTTLVNSTTFTNNATTYQINWTNLPNQNYAYNITAFDLASNSNSTTTFTIRLDTVIPNGTLLLPGNGTSKGGSNNFTVNITDNLGIKNATLNIFNVSSGNIINQTTFTNGPTSTLQQVVGIVVALTDGVYKWFYNIFDFAGNTFTTTNNTITIESTSPQLVINAPANNTQFNTTSVTINFTATGSNIASCATSKNGAANVTRACVSGVLFSYTDTFVEGINTLTVFINNTIGNTNTSTITFRVDTIVPFVSIIFPQNLSYLDHYNNFSLNVTVSDSGSGLSARWYSLNGGSNVLFTGNTTFNAILGSNTITLSANDSLNSVNTTTIMFYNGFSPRINTINISNTTTSYNRDDLTNSTSGLIGWWKFDMNMTTQIDSSLSLSNGTINAPFVSAGRIGGAYNFTGASAFMTATIPTLVTPYTVAFWYKPSATPSGGQDILTLRGLNPFPRITGGTTGRLLMYSGLEKYRYTAANTFVAGNWYYVVAVANGTNVSDLHIYVNGTLADGVGGANTGSYSEPTTSLKVGGSTLEEVIDELRIYNRSLSIAEINNLYSTTNPTFQERANITINVTTIDEDIPNSNRWYSWLINGIENAAGFAKETFSYIFTARSTNVTLVVNNTRNNTVVQNWIVNTQYIIPTINFTAPTPANANLRGTNTFTINVTGTEANVQAGWYTIDGTNASLSCIGSSPFYCSAVTSSLSDGVHSYIGWVNDSLGNQNSTEVRTITIDTTPPTGQILAPPNATNLNGNVTIFTSLSDTYAGVAFTSFQYMNSSVAWTNFSGCGAVTSTGPTCVWDTRLAFNNATAGYDVRLVPVDNLGNANTTMQINHYFIDRNAPYDAFITTYPAFQTSVRTSQNITLRANVTDGFGAGMNFTKVDLTNLNGTGNLTMNLQSGSLLPGQYSLWNVTLAVNTSTGIQLARIYAYDNATGLNNILTNNFIVQVDNAIPTFTNILDNRISPLWNGTNVTFNITASDNFKLAKWIFSNNFSGIWNNNTNASFNNGTLQSVNTTFTMLSGAYNYRWILFDDAGNSNQTSLQSISTREASPGTLLITLINPADLYSSQNPTVSFQFSYTNGTAINCSLYIDSTLERNLTSPASDSTLEINRTLVLGGHEWYVTCTNEVNTFFSSSRTLTIFDSIKPIINFTFPTQGSGVYLNVNNFTANITATDSFLSSIVLNLYNSDGLVQTNSTSSSPLFVSYSGLSDGVYYYNATALDTSSNENSTETRNVTVDTIKPIIYFTSPTAANSTAFNASSITATVSLTEINLANITYYLYNGTILVNTSIFTSAVTSTAWTGLSNGNYNYNVSTYDLAGNFNNTDLRSIRLDSQNPTATPVSPSSGGFSNSNTNNFTVNVTDNLGIKNITINVTDNNNNNQTVNYTTINQTNTGTTNTLTGFFMNLVDGVYNWFFNVYDWASNQITSTVSSFTIDTVSPGIQFVDPTSLNATNSSSNYIEINVTLSEINTANVTYYLWNLSFVPLNVTTISGSYNDLYIRFNNLNDGFYYYNVSTTDLGGSINSTELRSINISTVSPSSISFIPPSTETQINPPTNSTTIIAHINSSSNNPINRIVIYLNGPYATTQTIYFSEAYAEFTNLDYGTYQFYATVYDYFGNSLSTEVRTVIIGETPNACTSLARGFLNGMQWIPIIMILIFAIAVTIMIAGKIENGSMPYSMGGDIDTNKIRNGIITLLVIGLVIVVGIFIIQAIGGC